MLKKILGPILTVLLVFVIALAWITPANASPWEGAIAQSRPKPPNKSVKLPSKLLAATFPFVPQEPAVATVPTIGTKQVILVENVLPTPGRGVRVLAVTRMTNALC